MNIRWIILFVLVLTALGGKKDHHKTKKNAHYSSSPSSQDHKVKVTAYPYGYYHKYDFGPDNDDDIGDDYNYGYHDERELYYKAGWANRWYKDYEAREYDIKYGASSDHHYSKYPYGRPQQYEYKQHSSHHNRPHNNVYHEENRYDNYHHEQPHQRNYHYDHYDHGKYNNHYEEYYGDDNYHNEKQGKYKEEKHYDDDGYGDDYDYKKYDNKKEDKYDDDYGKYDSKKEDKYDDDYGKYDNDDKHDDDYDNEDKHDDDYDNEDKHDDDYDDETHKKHPKQGESLSEFRSKVEDFFRDEKKGEDKKDEDDKKDQKSGDGYDDKKDQKSGDDKKNEGHKSFGSVNHVSQMQLNYAGSKTQSSISESYLPDLDFSDNDYDYFSQYRYKH